MRDSGGNTPRWDTPQDSTASGLCFPETSEAASPPLLDVFWERGLLGAVGFLQIEAPILDNSKISSGVDYLLLNVLLSRGKYLRVQGWAHSLAGRSRCCVVTATFLGCAGFCRSYKMAALHLRGQSSQRTGPEITPQMTSLFQCGNILYIEEVYLEIKTPPTSWF